MPQGIFPKGNKGAFKKGFIPWNKGIPVPEEQKKRQAKSMTGKLAKEKHPMWGKHHSEETRRKVSIAKKGVKLSLETRAKMSKSRMGNTYCVGRKLSSEHIRKMLESRKGYRHSAETRRKLSITKSRGLTAVSTLIRHSFEYRQWVSDVFQRDDYTCQKCRERGGRLNAHHLKSFSLILRENNVKTFLESLQCAELWNINNGQTLCIRCHKETDTYLNKTKK